MSFGLWRFPVVCCMGWSLLAGCGRSDHHNEGAGTSEGGEDSGTGGSAGRSTGGTGASAGRAGNASGGTAASGANGGSSATGGGDASGASGEAGTAGTGGGSGGSGGAGGSSGATGGSAGVTAGSGGALPAEPVGFTALSRANPRDKLDLLLMVDNSISMFQKQALLADAIPGLVSRLARPNCVDDAGNLVGIASAAGTCASGTLEFAPMRDMHVGIITSSLGDHGSADICSPQSAATAPGSNYDDHAELLPSVRSGITDWNGSGFLLWDPRDQTGVSDPHSPLSATETDLATFTQAFVNQVEAVGEHGCGYEASLEAWYRFLIDPAPVSAMTRDATSNVSKRGDVNAVVLSQRAAFLRSDSVVVVLMMTDENDCSILDENGSQGWVVPYKGGNGVANFHMPHATSACASDPNDKCCQPCLTASIAGCPAPADDPECATPYLTTTEDSLNLRCFEQKRRFGIDLLYPTTRYIEGLTSRLIAPRNDGSRVPNPLFQGVREPSDVFLMGILGVPWQDLATEASWSPSNATLDYLTAEELAAADRWKVMLGDATTNRVPTDTLMVESIDPRLAQLPQTHPLLPDVKIGAPDATSNTNPINGHEQQTASGRFDLQFACIFPLSKPVACNADNQDGCDCNSDEAGANSPLCEGVTATTDGTQIAAKAYPSVRELEVLRGVGNQAVVTSICARNTTQGIERAPDYGYDPNVDALIERLRPAFYPSCLAVPLDVAATSPGGTSCHVAEILSEPTGACDCGGPGRTTPASSVLAMAHQHLEAHGACSGASCNSYCVCEITGLEGAALTRCQANMPLSSGDDGFCYIDPANGLGPASEVEGCAPGYERKINFVGSAAPLGDVFAACAP